MVHGQLAGYCVCDESNLTGEAMPVQKYAPSNGHDAYDPEGRGARHTLFSGTTVLQAGSSISDEVLGVVSATGRHLPNPPGTSKVSKSSALYIFWSALTSFIENQECESQL